MMLQKLRICMVVFHFAICVGSVTAQEDSAKVVKSIERLEKVTNLDFGRVSGNTFGGVRFAFHDRDTIAKRVSAFESIEKDSRFQEILIAKLKRPKEMFAAYQILNETHDPEFRIELLGRTIARNKSVGWMASVNLPLVESGQKTVSIGMDSISAILVDHWKLQFAEMNRQDKNKRSP